jgi:nucleotide-binding universal stress UspA family protein
MRSPVARATLTATREGGRDEHDPAGDRRLAVRGAGDRGRDRAVIGAHGWGAFERLVFGSVSTGVLHHAPCPVLVVRDTEQSERAAGERAAA